MTARAERWIRGATWAAALGVAMCVVVLSLDFSAARYREKSDERHIAALQEKVKTDSSITPYLESEEKRIADYHFARRVRIKTISWLLIAAAAGFLTGLKWLIKQRAPTQGMPQEQAEVVTPGASKRRRPSTVGHAAPAVDLGVVDAIIAREGRGREAAIPILQAIMAQFRYLPDEALRRVCETTEITPAQIAGTSSFYARFRRSPVGEHMVRVCHGTACHVAGARQITDELRRGLGIQEGADTDPSRIFTIEEVACLGCCSLAPVLMVDEHTVGKLRPATACDALDAVQPEIRA